VGSVRATYDGCNWDASLPGPVAKGVVEVVLVEVVLVEVVALANPVLLETSSIYYVSHPEDSPGV